MEVFEQLSLKKVYSSIKEKSKTTNTVSLTREEIDTDVKSQICGLLSQMKHKNVFNFIEADAKNIQLLDQVMKEKMQKIDLQIKEEVIPASGEALINKMKIYIGKFIGSGGQGSIYEA
jgi:hypothetical protein